MLDYPQLAAPAQHGGVLVAPDPHSCVRLARTNSAQLNSSSAKILGSTLGSLRDKTRTNFSITADSPVIVVGHQPDFIHAGVWAKNVFAHRLARAMQGTAVNLIVDSDAPKRLSLRIPIHHEGRFAVRDVSMGKPRTGLAYEQIQALPASEVQALKHEVAGLMGSRFSASLTPCYFDGLAEAQASDWVSQVTAGRRRVEMQFDIVLRDVRIRDSWWSPLAAHLLLDSGGFASAYNESLHTYRVQNKIRSPNRPIPDLVIEAGRIELPFWSYVLDQPRSRVFVEGDRRRVTLLAQSDPIATLSREQIESCDDIVEFVRKESGWLLRPRALITTIWARLFLADLFVHGIGGAKYDRISDLIIARYFKVPAPEIACVTATLYMDPNAGKGEDPATFKRRLRDALWNPQRHVPPPVSPELRDMLKQRHAVAQMSDELGRTRPKDRDARRAAFLRIHRLNDQIHASCPEILDGLQNELNHSRIESADRRIARDREYFFALHSRTSLEFLLNALSGLSDFVQS